MKELEQLFFKTQTVFRSWLKKNHSKSPGIWLVFYKKHIKTESLYYKEALDVALCYGWIDSTVKRIDDEKYMQMFTPRSNKKNWSDVNKKKVMELIEKGEMTEAGLNKIDVYVKTGKLDWKIEEKKKTPKTKLVLPTFIEKELAANEPALTNFLKLSASNKRFYIEWISTAKRPETIAKRLNQTIDYLKHNEKPGLL